MKRCVVLMLVVFLAACSQMKQDQNRYRVDQSYAKKSTELQAGAQAFKANHFDHETAYQLPQQPRSSKDKGPLTVLPPKSLVAELSQQDHEAQSEHVIQQQNNKGVVWEHLKRAIAASEYTVLEADQQLGIYFIWQHAGEEQASNDASIYQIRVVPVTPSTSQIALFDELNQPLAREKIDKLIKALKIS